MLKQTTEQDLKEFIAGLSENNKVFVPNSKGVLVPYSENSAIDFSVAPVWGSSREFLLPLINKVTEISGKKEQIIVFGLKACDIRAARYILDKVFAVNKPPDSVYAENSENMILISSDCYSPASSCFCLTVGGKPYDSGLSDANLSYMDNVILVELNSGKASDLFSGYEFLPLDKKQIYSRIDKRNLATRIIKNNKLNNKNSKESAEHIYYKFADICIECGACCYNCPSCYCTELKDISKNTKKTEKIAVIDSCMIPGYSAAASGSEPLALKNARFKNRHLCKMKHMNEEFGIYGCVGCGRCIKVCPADIDIRELFVK